MTKKFIFVCDKCKKDLTNVKDLVYFKVKSTVLLTDVERKDLCKKCFYDFLDWIRGEEIETEEEKQFHKEFQDNSDKGVNRR